MYVFFYFLFHHELAAVLDIDAFLQRLVLVQLHALWGEEAAIGIVVHLSGHLFNINRHLAGIAEKEKAEVVEDAPIHVSRRGATYSYVETSSVVVKLMLNNIVVKAFGKITAGGLHIVGDESVSDFDFLSFSHLAFLGFGTHVLHFC